MISLKEVTFFLFGMTFGGLFVMAASSCSHFSEKAELRRQREEWPALKQEFIQRWRENESR